MCVCVPDSSLLTVIKEIFFPTIFFVEIGYADVEIALCKDCFFFFSVKMILYRKEGVLREWCGELYLGIECLEGCTRDTDCLWTRQGCTLH